MEQRAGAFAHNQWYAAAWIDEIGERPLGRRVLGERVVLFRDGVGKINALHDLCPHRLVPLSMGTVTDIGLQCGYHGMTFDGAGICVRIPGQSTIPPRACVRSYPIEERYGIAWIWMGRETAPDPAKLPQIPYYGEDGWGLIDGGYQHHPSNYLNIVENLMDPSHTTFVHKQTIGNPAAADEPVTMERTDEHILAYKWIRNSPPSQMDTAIKDFGEENVDRGIFFYMILPTVSRVDVVTLPTGLEPTEENFNKGLRNNSYKFLTPETEETTHFFWLHLRNYRVDDAEWAQKMREIFEKTFLEDRDIEMAMQRSQNEFGTRQFVGLEIDRAPTVAIRMIQRMVNDEQAGQKTPVAAR
jgi:phenylpropionate dioxygenase-like ring-hydroxylating dioxygenase large terminal subunit